MEFHLTTTFVAVIAGIVASICGFGIGSLLTPLISIATGTKLAIAAVSIPHFLGTALRCWMLRKDINKELLFSFGIASAAGGLLGALLHNYIQAREFNFIFGGILIFAGSMGLSGLNERIRFKSSLAWLAGVLSGGLGGLVGNQGGIRSAAMLSFDLQPKAFVATATAVGLFVDLARMPVYFYEYIKDLANLWQLLFLTSLGVLTGTFIGAKFLKKIDKQLFKKIVSSFIIALGVWVLFQQN